MTVASIENFGIAVVLRSETPAVKPGDHFHGLIRTLLVYCHRCSELHWSCSDIAFKHYVILPSADNIRVLENKEGLPWSLYVGVAGMPGTQCLQKLDISMY